MAFNGAKENAESFIAQIRHKLGRHDSLIYSIESSIIRPNVISPSTVGCYDARISVKIYNSSKPDEALDSSFWVAIGQMGADYDVWEHVCHSDYNSEIEITKRFGDE